jgi:hypothetical protein
MSAAALPWSMTRGETHTRRYPRLKCFVAVTIRSRAPEVGVGNLSSIGLGGCGVETLNLVNPGITVEISPVEDERLAVIGDVVNQRVLVGQPGFGIGIAFSDTDDRINEFVKFVEGKTQRDAQEYWYLARLKRADEGAS